MGSKVSGWVWLCRSSLVWNLMCHFNKRLFNLPETETDLNEFSLNGDIFSRFYRISRNTKKSSSKILPHAGFDLRTSDFPVLHFTPQLVHMCCQPQRFKWSCSHALLIVGKKILADSTRWTSSGVKCRTGKWEVVRSNLTWGNILLLDIFYWGSATVLVLSLTVG